MSAAARCIEMILSARRPGVIGAVSALLVAPIFALRMHEAESGLPYPDGYQYLLMAKGIAAHGRPLLTLGPHGDTLLPSADAAVKPLYPAIVALVHACGLDWLGAARAVTALAAASTIILTGLLARRLFSSSLAGAVAGVACLASRELSFWSGFSGPDALGQALGLGSALAFLDRRPRVGGALAALAILARPELGLVALAAGGVGLLRAELRPAVYRASAAAVVSLAVFLAIVRPPIAAAPASTLLPAGALAAVAVAAFVLTTRGSLRAGNSVVVVGLAATAVIVPFARGAAGIRHWMEADWPLLLAALAGCAVAARTPRFRPALHVIALVSALLVSVYTLKNPAADRYLSLLTPLIAVLASIPIAAGSVMRTRVVATAVAGLVAVTLVLPRLPQRSNDPFQTVAGQLRALHFPRLAFVTAAPDAYGVLLPNQSFVVARPGARGLIIADAAQRAYAPSLRLSGRTVATLDPGAGFVRPDGAIDRQPVRIVLGTIAERRAAPGRLRGRASAARGGTRRTSASRG